MSTSKYVEQTPEEAGAAADRVAKLFEEVRSQPFREAFADLDTVAGARAVDPTPVVGNTPAPKPARVAAVTSRPDPMGNLIVARLDAQKQTGKPESLLPAGFEQPTRVTAKPAPAKAAVTPKFTMDGGEIVTGISDINYAINGEVFGSVPDFIRNVQAGNLTPAQRTAFLAGGNKLIDSLNPENSSEAFADYLGKLTVAVGNRAYPGRDYAGNDNEVKPIYAAIAAQMDMWRTSGLSPEQIVTKMFEPGSLAQTVSLIRALEKPAPAVNRVEEQTLLSAAEERQHLEQGPINMDQAARGVAAVLTPNGTSLGDRLKTALCDNGSLKDLLGARIDFNGDGKIDTNEREAVADVIWKQQVAGKSAAEIAEALGGDKLIGKARKEYGESMRDQARDTQFASNTDFRIIPEGKGGRE